MANVVKRYSREIDMWMMLSPSLIFSMVKNKHNGLTKGVGAGQM